MPAPLEQWFDAIWIYGDTRLYDTVAAYGLNHLHGVQVTPVGYLDASLRQEGRTEGTTSPGTAGSVLATHEPPYALCMMGGGQDGLAVAHARYRSQEQVARKFRQGAQALAATGLDSHYGGHWRQGGAGLRRGAGAHVGGDAPW